MAEYERYISLCCFSSILAFEILQGNFNFPNAANGRFELLLFRNNIFYMKVSETSYLFFFEKFKFEKIYILLLFLAVQLAVFSLFRLGIYGIAHQKLHLFW